MNTGPLLKGDASAAWRAIEAISVALRPRLPDRPGISSGSAGEALFFHYLAQATGDHTALAEAERRCDHAMTWMAEEALPPTFYHGFSGVAWSALHLRDEAPGEDDTAAEIDEALLTLLRVPRWTGDYDLIYGLVGYAVYALSRLPAPGARECLELVVSHLEAVAQPLAKGAPRGLTLWTRPELLTGEQRADFSGGFFNFGVAHGVPGVVSVLASACAAGVAVERARPLLDGLVEGLLAQELPGAAFPAMVADGQVPQPARTAWCYGVPGISVTLLGAARAVGDPSWEAAALRLGRASIAPGLAAPEVVDAGLCHGAAGLGLVYLRLFQATGDPLFGEAARAWYERVVTEQPAGLRFSRGGIGGYRAWTVHDGKSTWIDDATVLTGAAGIGLSLLAAVTEIQPRWDAMFLLSSPVPESGDP